MRRLFPSLTHDTRGTVAIETAFVVPVLMLMSLGSFEASSMFARQVELQDAAGEAFEIALAAPPADTAGQDTLKEIISASTGLAEANIDIKPKYRCGTDDGYVDDATECPDEYAHFVQITLTDTYEPMFAGYAFGSNIEYNVTRLVQVG